jgi:hypothetical protein
VTVAQLEHRVAADHGRSDRDLAGHLENLELTQRLSSARLQKLQAVLPGPESRDALMALEDLSAALAPPAGEIPADPAPTAAEQQQMLARAQDASNSSSADQMPGFDVTVNLTRFRNLKYLTGDYSRPIAVVKHGPDIYLRLRCKQRIRVESNPMRDPDARSSEMKSRIPPVPRF